MLKFELTNNTKVAEGKTLYQIRSLKDFRYAKKGELGGWVEKATNLSLQGSCWIFPEATVTDDARICDAAVVKDQAIVSENSIISGSAVIEKNAQAMGFSHVGGHAIVGEWAVVKGHSLIDEWAIVKGGSVICGVSKILGMTFTDKDTYAKNVTVDGGDLIGVKIGLETEEEEKEEKRYRQVVLGI